MRLNVELIWFVVVCFLTSKPFRPGGMDLFVVCLVSIGCSLLCYKFPPNFFKTNSKNKLHKTNFCFDHFLVFLLFYSIVFYSKRDFLIALTLWLSFKHTEHGLSKNQLR